MRRSLRAAAVLLAAALLLGLQPDGYAATFVVLSNGDTSDLVPGDGSCFDPIGQCTLRAAIEEANAWPGSDTIVFTLPGAPPFVIQPTSAELPKISDTLHIDARTQPGYTGTPVVAIDGSLAPSLSDGLEFIAGSNSSSVRGISIHSFPNVGINLRASHSSVVESSWIGVDPFLGAAGNRIGIDIVGSTGCTVGGTGTGAGNYIAGNVDEGIRLAGAGASGNSVLGNFIGTLGSTAVPNRRGIYIASAPNNQIGGTTPAARNFISGNTEVGIRITGTTATGNVIEGNFIGTNSAGSAAVPNGGEGIYIEAGTDDNRIGGTAAGAGNVISGNAATGIYVFGGVAVGFTIQGNLIGLDATGTSALPNPSGIVLDGNHNQVGGADPGARNVISGNTNSQITVVGNQNVVEGNYVGTDVGGGFMGAGTGTGVIIFGGDENRVGGLVPGAGNVIAGVDTGIGINGLISSEQPLDNLIQGNWIGTDATGTAGAPIAGSGITFGADAGNTVIEQNVIASCGSDGIALGLGSIVNTSIRGNRIGVGSDGATPLGNGRHGVYSSTGNAGTIGGPDPADANTIAHNAADGIFLESTVFGWEIVGNAIHSNGELGIDLAPDGPNPNDPGDADSGGNHSLNTPVIASAGTTVGGIHVDGSYAGYASSQFELAFYASTICDPSGTGEGEVYLGSAPVTTDGAGNTPFSVLLPASVQPGRFVTATATWTSGDQSSSEFSACVVAAALAPALSQGWQLTLCTVVALVAGLLPATAWKRRRS